MHNEPPTAATPGRYGRIGKYDIVAHIATGGVCVVYRAVDIHLGREVALKVLPPETASNTAALERFRREARHAARLRHKNLVAVYEFGESNGTYFLALEFVEGTDLLRYVIEKGQLEPAETLGMVGQAARALEHLHAFGIVHRDIKPSNLLLSWKKGRPHVKLTDFGLARIPRDEEFRVTRAGFTVGTIDYMAPEQARDSSLADIRSDIYALGCTWYHLLTGNPPFAEGSLAERLYKHLNEKPPDIRQFNPSVPRALSPVLERMLEKDPQDRYQTPTELLAALAELGRKKGPRGGGKSRQEARPPERPPKSPDPISRDTARDGDLPSASYPAPSSEQLQAAAGQFERANQVIASGNYDYGIHLLLSCCKLDPANLAYRRALRRSEYARLGGGRASRFVFLATSKTKGKLKAAKSAHDHLQVLQLGEEVLARNPDDVGTQLEMAEAAEALSLSDVAVWILEQAWERDRRDLTVARALAGMCERHGRFEQAIRAWEEVHRADPSDVDASRKARDLAATETIARGQYAGKRSPGT
jgi:serine/threonine protein kinase